MNYLSGALHVASGIATAIASSTVGARVGKWALDRCGGAKKPALVQKLAVSAGVLLANHALLLISDVTLASHALRASLKVSNVLICVMYGSSLVDPIVNKNAPYLAPKLSETAAYKWVTNRCDDFSLVAAGLFVGRYFEGFREAGSIALPYTISLGATCVNLVAKYLSLEVLFLKHICDNPPKRV